MSDVRTVSGKAPARTKLMTTEEYLNTPEVVLPQELIYGVLRVADAPLPRHQAAVRDFCLALGTHVYERRLGEIWLSPIDVILDAARSLVVQPDLLFISNERSGILTDRIRGAPDMVLEVLSPHPRIGRLEERVRWFAQYGVRECWLLHQLARRFEILSFSDGKTSSCVSFDYKATIRSEVLPEFRQSIDSILRWGT